MENQTLLMVAIREILQAVQIANKNWHLHPQVALERLNEVAKNLEELVREPDASEKARMARNGRKNATETKL